MNKYTVLPLLNSSFEPGKALETVEQFEDKDFRNIAMAELYYFTGKAKECCEITEIWKMKKWNCAFRRVCFIVMQI